MFYDKKTMTKYIVPLTMFLVTIVFIFLMISMGIMGLGRLDKTLVEFMENRGLDIIKTVENITQENIMYLRQSLKEPRKDVRIADKKMLSYQETLVRTIGDLASDIDTRWRNGQLTEKDLKEVADRENISLITFLGKQGEILFQSKDFIDKNKSTKKLSISNNKEIVEYLLDIFGRLEGIGYITFRRKDRKGSIIIALDSKETKYWSIRITINKVIEDIGWGQGLAYLIIIDNDGRLLSQAGEEVPENTKTIDKAMIKKILDGKSGMLNRKITLNGDNFLEIIAPFHIDEAVAGYARLGLKRSGVDNILRENKYRMFATMLFIGIIGITSIWILYRNQNKHLAKIEEMEKRLQRAERLSSLGQLAAGVAHEIRNPLNAISMASQRLKREYAPEPEDKREEFYHITEIIRDEIRRLNEIIEEFATFFRSRRLDLQAHPVTDAVQKVVDVIEEEAKARGVSIQTVYENESIMIQMDSDKLRQAIYNIMKNAMESISGKGSISLHVRPYGNKMVNINISDTGSGLTPDEIDRIFNPEYTTKEKGLGLGLPLAHEIIRGHKGEIHVKSRLGAGTSFEILLPIATDQEGTDRK